jgi:hypothetical protein
MREHEVKFQSDLGGRCTVPGCPCTERDSELYIHSRCHPRSGMELSYRLGVLTVRCRTCKRHVASIAIAERSATP